MRVKMSFLLALFLLFSTISIGAQEPQEAPETEETPGPGAPSFGMNFGLGTQVIDGETWQTLSFVPDFSIGPFGVGLDLNINFQLNEGPGGDFGFYPRPEDWYLPDGTWQENLDLYLSRIVYLRWGKKGEPFYTKLGLIEDGTLGNGFIMGNYSNGVLRPEKKYVGLALDLDGQMFGVPAFGFETFVGNITAFDVFGGRLFVRPLAYSEIPIIKDFQVGGTYVTDRNPYYHQPDADDKPADVQAVSVFGGDVKLPILGGDIFSLAVFSDIAFLQNGSKGIMGGLGGKLLALFSWSAQARFLDENFLATYFDQGYDLNRTQKYQIVHGNETIPAYNGWFVSMGANLLEDVIVFNASLEGPLGSLDTITGDAAESLAYPKLRAAFLLAEGLLPVAVTAFYNKDNIQSFASLFGAEDALIGAKVSYKTGAAVLSLVYNVRYIPENDPAYVDKPWEVTSKLEVSISLF